MTYIVWGGALKLYSLIHSFRFVYPYFQRNSTAEELSTFVNQYECDAVIQCSRRKVKLYPVTTIASFVVLM